MKTDHNTAQKNEKSPCEYKGFRHVPKITELHADGHVYFTYYIIITY
jgi:hypothetical protein